MVRPLRQQSLQVGEWVRDPYSCHRLSLNEGPLTLVCRFEAAGPLSTKNPPLQKLEARALASKRIRLPRLTARVTQAEALINIQDRTLRMDTAS